MYDTARLTHRFASSRAADHGSGALVQAAVERLDEWRRRQRERRELALLGDRDLRDFGATRADAAAELRKPFWRR